MDLSGKNELMWYSKGPGVMSIFTIQEILEDLVVQRTLLERYIFNK